MAFAYFLVFPGIFKYLVMTTPRGVKMMTDVREYVSFAMTTFVAFGLSFELAMAGPMWLLYEAELVTARVLLRLRVRHHESAPN